MQQQGTQQSPQNMNLQTGSGIPYIVRKASESTMQLAEYLKQKCTHQPQAQQNYEEDYYDEEQYNNLSSGVYQVSKLQEDEEQPEQEQRQYFSQQITVGNSLPSSPELKEQSQKQQEHQQIVKEQQPLYQEIDVEKQKQPEGVEPQKLQLQTEQKLNQPMEALCPFIKQESHYEHDFDTKSEPKQEEIIEEEQSHNEEKEQMEFFYPSIMEQSIKQHHFGLHFETKSQEKHYEEVDVQEQIPQKLTYDQILKTKQQPSPPIIKQIEHQEPLIVLDHRQETRPITSKAQTHSHFYQSPKLQQISMEQSQRRLKPIIQSSSIPTLRIIGYQKEYFLKIQTQVYQIEFSSPQNTYTFSRKYGDFATLHKMIRLQYLGFILYPFPESNMQFFKKIKLSVGTQVQKIVLIEQRLLELQRYLNFLFQHPELSHSQILEIFIAESNELFTRQCAYIEQTLEKQEQQFSSSKLKSNYNSLKKMVKSSFNFFSSYMSNSPTKPQNTTLFLQIKRKSQQLLTSYSKITLQLEKNMIICSNFQAKIQKLIELYAFNKGFQPIESSIDSVLKLSTKMAASRSYYQQHQNWIEDHLLTAITYFVNIFGHVETLIHYRTSLLERAAALDCQETKLASNLLERVEQFDSRFLQDWRELHIKFQKQYSKMVQQFSTKWRSHCLLMTKIWK